MGCKFCHLTHMGPEHQSMKGATLDDYRRQLAIVMEHVHKQTPLPSSKININFMARGDCLANPTVVRQYASLYDSYKQLIVSSSQPALKMNLSTIMPNVVRPHSLVDMFAGRPAYMYYSLYSTDEAFRKRWLPNAMPYQAALEKLHEYQQATGHELTFHWAFIRRQNDSPSQVDHLCRTIEAMRFSSSTKFNLVRFNPPPGPEGHEMHEPDEESLRQLWVTINSVMQDKRQRGRIIDRVGKDVNASCGMFTP